MMALRHLFGGLCAIALALPLHANNLYLVRHAEKAAGQDPGLTQCGQARAQALANRFADTRLVAVFSSDTRRTRGTAGPTARGQGLPVTLYDPFDLTALAEQLMALEGDALVVGHSNTTPELAALLSGQPGEAIGHDEFDWLYRVPVSGEKVLLVRQNFHCNGNNH